MFYMMRYHPFITAWGIVALLVATYGLYITVDTLPL
jgi:hypothetical protein